MYIAIHNSLQEIDPTQWNSLLNDNNPFMRHEFLNGLELTRCVCKETGWQPHHIAIYTDKAKKELLAAMPCYIKSHSYGEYIFDWSWAEAFHRNGLDYYPKLSNAVPFTPATGPRWLAKEEKYATELIKKALQITEEKNLSSFHCLFLPSKDTQLAEQNELSIRHSNQFHWHNSCSTDNTTPSTQTNNSDKVQARRYDSFDDFLNALSSKKRKNIRRERRRVVESKISYRWVTGSDFEEHHTELMYQFYLRTIKLYGGQSYLNKAFFDYLGESFASQTLFLFAYYEDQAIAGGVYFKSDDTLYGRYWGALDNFHSVHFETCYYQAIDWCIQHGYNRFEAGAQGEHKIARGLQPSTTYSAHWISHPAFRDAIINFVEEERQHLAQYNQAIETHSPFKKNA